MSRDETRPLAEQGLAGASAPASAPYDPEHGLPATFGTGWKGRLLFCFGRYDYVSEHGLPFLPPLAVSPGEQEENVSGVRTAIYDCKLETKQRENGEIAPMEYFGQYRGIGRYEMELPGKGAYLLSGLADIVTISQKEKTEVFFSKEIPEGFILLI